MKQWMRSSGSVTAVNQCYEMASVDRRWDKVKFQKKQDRWPYYVQLMNMSNVYSIVQAILYRIAFLKHRNGINWLNCGEFLPD